MVAENSLSTFIKYDINEMITADKKIGPNDRVIIYIDDIGAPRIYEIDSKTQAYTINTLDAVYTYPTILDNDQNSCSREVMESVFRYICKKYPSDSYGLILSSHGMGWLPPLAEVKSNNSTAHKAFGLDNGENSLDNVGDEMCIYDLAEAIKTLPHLDFIFSDLCYMQCIEVAFQFRNCADYIFGSPAEIPGTGAPYDKILTMLLSKEIDYRKIVDTYAMSYTGWQKEEPTSGLALSAISCDYLDSLKAVTNKMTAKYGDKIKECRYNGTTCYLDSYYASRYRSGFYDMREMMQLMMDEADFAEWSDMYSKAVPYYYVAPKIYSNAKYVEYGTKYVITDPENCGGVAMSLDPSESLQQSIIQEYEILDWKY